MGKKKLLIDFVREKLPPLLKEKGELRDAVADIVRECIAEETENLLSKIGNKEETARLEKELSDTKKEKKRLEGELSYAKKEIERLENEIGRLDTKISDLTKKNGEQARDIITANADKSRLEKDLSAAEDKNKQLAKDKKKAEDERTKIDDLRQKAEIQARELSRLFPRGRELFARYGELSENTRRNLLSGIFVREGNFHAFICSAAQDETIGMIWDAMKSAIRVGNDGDVKILRELFAYAVDLTNLTKREKLYEILKEKVGAEYDMERHSPSADSRAQGVVGKIYLEGYKNLYMGKIVQKSIVKLE